MFGHRFYGARYFGPRYWGDGGLGTPEPPAPEVIPAGAAIRARLRPRERPEIVRASITVTGGGDVRIVGRKSVELPPDDDVLQFLGMI